MYFLSDDGLRLERVRCPEFRRVKVCNGKIVHCDGHMIMIHDPGKPLDGPVAVWDVPPHRTGPPPPPPPGFVKPRGKR